MSQGPTCKNRCVYRCEQDGQQACRKRGAEDRKNGATMVANYDQLDGKRNTQNASMISIPRPTPRSITTLMMHSRHDLPSCLSISMRMESPTTLGATCPKKAPIAVTANSDRREVRLPSIEENLNFCPTQSEYRNLDHDNENAETQPTQIRRARKTKQIRNHNVP